MNLEQINSRTSETRLPKRGKRLRNALVATVAVAASGAGAAEVAAHRDTTDFEGSMQIKLGNGDTLWAIAHNEVEGGASHTQEVVDEIVKRNPDVFQDGTPYIGFDDFGQSIEIPKRVS